MVTVAKIKTLLANSRMDDIERKYWIAHIPYMPMSKIKEFVSILEAEQDEENRIKKQIKELSSILKQVS